MKHKVSELTGALLDAAVAKAEGLLFSHIEDETPWLFLSELRTASVKERPRFSIRWDAGGPIIEREQIIWRHHGDGRIEACVMRGVIGVNRRRVGKQFGATLLQAAMRSFVASKFGEEFEL